MPLQAVDFVPKGPVKSADIQQFFNLFTGVMVDQPVTFSNTLSVGGTQGTSTVPLKLYGAIGQTTHLLDLYPDRTSAQPGFGFSALGAFGWGPGGSAPIDTTLSRIALQGHVSDTPGLLITPQLEVSGDILPHGAVRFGTAEAIADGGSGVINIGTHLAVQGTLYIGYDRVQYIHEVTPSQMGIDPTLLIHGANAAGSGLGYANAHLQVRSDDMPDVAGTMLDLFSAYGFGVNWMQFDVHLYKVTAGVAWPGVALLLDYDVDSANAVGGRIGMMNGKIGIGGIPAAAGDTLQVFGNETVNGGLTVTAGLEATQIDTIAQTFQHAANSGNAQLAFPQAVGPKISLYDAGGGLFFGMGIDSAEMYMCVPATSSFNLRQGNGAGAVLLSVTADGRLHTTHDIVIAAPSVINLGPQPGGALVSPGTNIGKSGDTVYLANHAYVFFDLGVGHVVTCQQVIQTSDPALKANSTLMSDANCMARIRGNVPVYQYTLAPPTPPPGSPPIPQPTQPDIGFMAPDVYANSPEFCGVDGNNTPTGVNYANMAALIWGALRSLDARCVAKNI